jgi:hypothetical protein
MVCLHNAETGHSRGPSHGNHTHARTSSFAARGANRPTSMMAIPEDTRATDNIVSGHPLRLCSKLRNNAFISTSFARETNYCTVWKWDRAEGATI